MNAPLHLDGYPQWHVTPLLFAEEVAAYGGADEPLAQATQGPDEATDWKDVHARIVRLGSERAGLEHALCRWLLAAERLGVAARAGFSSLREYAERVAGLKARQTEERLRVARLLSELPVLDQALASGMLCWSAVKELSRVVTPDTERTWVDWATGRRLREIERAVAAREPGDGPHDRAQPELVKHRLSFEVRAETMALFRDLQASVRADLTGEGRGIEVDDDTLLFEIARRALGGPGDEGRASYQVAVTRCGDCGRVDVDAGGQAHEVDEVVAAMVACDSQQLGDVEGGEAGGPHMGAEPGVGAPAGADPRAPGRRATQTIPPATRRRVMRRDRKRCVVVGCDNHRFLDVHHLDPRSEGGRHDPERMAVLCGSHHRAAHVGTLCVEGSASAGFTFRHADGTHYGQPLRPAAMDLTRQVFSALRNLGFPQTRARVLVDAVLRADAPEDPADFLRAALQRA